MTTPVTPLAAAGVPDLTAVLGDVADRDPPLLFAAVAGAHLYGFASRDSDVDLRGVHLLPLREVTGLREGEHTRTRMSDREER